MDSIPATQPKPFVFVLMPFEPKFNDIYKYGIKGAAEDVGAYAERLDEQIFDEGMLDRIFNQISKADVVVADMTGRNPNVFYEVGYAHALGKMVLLLTQDSDDIPFDLKHHHHTVYEGQIETLRKSLAPRLEWAIRESKNRTGNSVERISLQLLHLHLASGIDGQDDPEIASEVGLRTFFIPLLARNDGVEPLIGISHIYLFTVSEPDVVPVQSAPWKAGGISSSASWSSGTGYPGSQDWTIVPQYEEVPGFTASLLDAADDLTSQFRLPLTFASIPPGAVEQSSIGFAFRKGKTECDQRFRLRLHTQSGSHDYRFRMRLLYRESQT